MERGDGNMNFGKQIKKVRTDNKLTQEQLAQKLMVSRQAVSSLGE